MNRIGRKIKFSEKSIVRNYFDILYKLTNNNVHSASYFSTSNLTSSPSYASGFKFECSSQITQIKVTFTDLDLEHTVYPRMSIPGLLIHFFLLFVKSKIHKYEFIKTKIKAENLLDFASKSKSKKSKIENFTEIKRLITTIPKHLLVDFFPFFSTNEGFLLDEFFLNYSNDRGTFLYRVVLITKLLNQTLTCKPQKTEDDLTKKFF